MSGGSFDYEYLHLQDLFGGQMKDEVLNELLEDFCEVLHDLEWWEDCDISEKDYRETVKAFKDKWLNKSAVVELDIKVVEKLGAELAETARELMPKIYELLKESQKPQGEWLEQTDFEGEIYYECSVCKETWYVYDGAEMSGRMNYCPVCGADMRRREDGSQQHDNE